MSEDMRKSLEASVGSFELSPVRDNQGFYVRQSEAQQKYPQQETQREGSQKPKYVNRPRH